MIDPNQLLIGFVVGVCAGLYLAYKFSQRSKMQPPSQPRPPVRQNPNAQVQARIVEGELEWRKV